jgi:hypothetical protein
LDLKGGRLSIRTIAAKGDVRLFSEANHPAEMLRAVKRVAAIGSPFDLRSERVS